MKVFGLDQANLTPTEGTRPLVCVEENTALPLLGVSISARTGSFLDPKGKEGAARLMARLIRRCGGGRSAHETDELLDGIGAALGVEVASSTVGLHGGVISRNLEPYANALVDVLCHPTFREDDLALLKQEAESELLELIDNDRALARRWFRRRLFPEHPYGRLAGGTLESLKRITLDDIRSIYEAIFHPDNLILAFSGDIGAEAATVARRLLEPLPPGPTPADSIPDPSVPDGRRLVFVDKPERSQTQILIGGLGTHPRDEDHTALHVANTIFGGTFTARLSNEVRAKRGWSYGAYSSLPFDRRRQAFSMWTFPKADDAAACIELQLGLLEELRLHGVTKKELTQAKKYLRRSHAFSVDTASKRVGLTVDEALYDLPPDYYSQYTARIADVTLEQVNASIQNRLSSENLLITVVGTDQLVGDAIRRSIAGLEHHEVVAFDRTD